jgi:hypothetical protein
MATPLEVQIVAPSWKVYERKLAHFPKRYKSAMERAMRQATRIHVRSLRQVTPKKTGRLRAGWVVRRNTPVEGVIVNRVPYVNYIEFGTAPHVILPKRALALRFKPKGSSKYVFAKRVQHPGTRPYRMLKRAWQLDAHRIRTVFKREFQKEVDRL